MVVDVVLSDGSTVRVTGLLAVRFQQDPDAVREFLEDDIKRLTERSTDIIAHAP